jgi:hypothetical protein
VKKLVYVGAAVAAFAALAVIMIVVATSGGPAQPGAGPAPAPDAAAQAAAAMDAGYLPPPPPLPTDPRTGLQILPTGGPSAPPPMDPRPPPPPKGSWEAVPPAARPGALGPAGAAISGVLSDLQPRLSACFDEVSQARHGRDPVAEAQDATLEDQGGTTVLMLEIEASRDEVRIVDAPVESRGGASDGLVACAQRVLRGHRAPAPGVKPGQRFRLLYTLTQ